MIFYRLRLRDLHAHLVEVEIDLPATGEKTTLALPAWSPGSYLVRDYARHVRDFAAFEGRGADGGDGRPLGARKIDKQTFEVQSAGAARVRFRYGVFAHDLSVRTSHVDGRHAFLHGPSVFVYAPAQLREPIRLRVEAPSGWEVVTSLLRLAEGELSATDYDHLVDAPIEMGSALRRLPFQAGGRPHEIVLCGRPATPIDGAALVDDVARIVESAASLFGGLPYDRYVFFLHLSAAGGQGGLEHRDSAALLASPHAFRPRKRYEDLLELFCHEHFHAWNVKRIRPRALGPFDYARESYTRSLWVIEGVTSYYDRALLVRAGLLPPKRYLERIGEDLARLREVPGRLVQSLEEASFDAWIKFYKPDEFTPNSTVSYYLKGSLVALALDLEIRRASGGRRSLDDAMRLLFARYGAAPGGFDDDAVQSLVEEATGLSLGPFFDAHVRGPGEIELDRALEAFGLRLQPAPPSPAEGPGPAECGAPEGGWLGVTTREAPGGRTQIASVLGGGPAERGGLYAGDEIVAIDGYRVDERTLRERLLAFQPGEQARLSVFRRDELLEVAVELGARPPERILVTADPKASAEARSLYEGWLGPPFPS